MDVNFVLDKNKCFFPTFIKVTGINSREFHSSTVNILNGNYLENQMFLHGLSYISSVCLKSIFLLFIQDFCRPEYD